MPLLFVYGTLQKGGKYHHYLEKAPYTGKAKSLADFVLSRRTSPEDPEGCPVATPGSSAKACKIEGELYDIDGDMLKAIDALEEYPGEYDRKMMEFETPDGARLKAFIYTGHQNNDV